MAKISGYQFMYTGVLYQNQSLACRLCGCVRQHVTIYQARGALWGHAYLLYICDLHMRTTTTASSTEAVSDNLFRFVCTVDVATIETLSLLHRTIDLDTLAKAE